MRIKAGTVGSLTLKIPWSNLGSEAAVVRIEDVFLLLAPQRGAVDAAEGAERALAQKLGRLQLAEMLGLDAPPSDKPQATQEPEKRGWFESLAMKVVDNIQIFLDRVHVRYEDEGRGEPFAAGLTLDALHAQSTDAQWQPSFLTVAQKIVHKLVSLSHLALYFNTSGPGARPLTYTSLAELQEAMRAQIASPAHTPAHHFLLRPVSASLQAELDSEKRAFERPRVRLRGALESLTFALDRQQYLRALSLADGFTLAARGSRYQHLRPPQDSTPSSDPRAWWGFALAAVRSDVRARLVQWQWPTIRQRRLDRDEYMALHKLRKRDAVGDPH